MNETTHTKPRSALWRAIKVFFGAWAFAVAGTILFAVVTLVVGGQGEATGSLRYATPFLFFIGVPIMARWLK
jgi:hypothetical protein